MLMKNIRLFPWLALSAILVPGIPPSALAQDTKEVVEEESEEPETTPAIEETITVIGIRAGDELPVTKTNLDAQQIDTLSYGQDVPQLLQYTPAMTWYSDSGIGSNYSYFSMRGIQQTRINMTFDGAPLNDPAEHAVYFNNFHDFTNTVDSVQIQRGVGTSSVGSPSYGGSVNFASSPPAQDRGGDLRLALGSYDTKRASFGYESGVSRERVLRRRPLLLCRHRWIPGQLRNQAPDGLPRRGLARRAIFVEVRLLLR